MAIITLFTAGLTSLMLSCYLEWKTKSQLGTRPVNDETAFKAIANLSALLWVAMAVSVFLWMSWYWAMLSILLSIMAPAFVIQNLIDRDIPGAIVYGGFLTGLILCVSAYVIST